MEKTLIKVYFFAAEEADYGACQLTKRLIMIHELAGGEADYDICLSLRRGRL